MQPQAKITLVETAQDMLQRLDSQQIDRSPEVARMPASHYFSHDRFAQEKQQLFRRIPLMLAASCELPEANTYKAMEVAGVPVLLVRNGAGEARAFLNACTHRGSQLAEGCGKASRFSCPYHGWTFTADGKLLAVAAARYFGEVDKAGLGLREFPLQESAGLIWVVLDPASQLDISAFLQGVDAMLDGFGLASWQRYDQRVLTGANWKLAFDAHMDFYHLPILHKATFGPTISNLAQYYFHGPHQRLGLMSGNSVEQDSLLDLKNLPVEDWPMESMLFGEWILFPNVSLNCFKAGPRVMVISQVLPGATPDSSVTIQTFLTEHEPGADAARVDELIAFLGQVVGEEDLAMSQTQQRALDSGLLPDVLFGRNEKGLQEYYRWLEQVLLAENDTALNRLFIA